MTTDDPSDDIPPTGPSLADPETARTLRAAARELADIAGVMREVSVHATGALTAGAVPGALHRAPGAALRAEQALLHAVTNRKGLGYALAGGPAGTVGAKLGSVLGARSLAVSVMTTSLRLRIAAVTLDNPELAADPVLARLNEAVAADREIEAARALYALVKDRGAARALTAIAPVFGEILALRALLDENPLNDHTAWMIASGSAAATADPVSGVSNLAIALLDVGGGAARRVEADPPERRRLRETGSLLDFLTNIGVVGTTGRVLIQTVTGPDGVERHVVQAPGMRPGNPDNDSPGDLLGAFSSTLLDSAPYSRSLAKAVADYGIPEGAEIALVGHSAGGSAVMTLAQDPAFASRYTITHVVVVGSPVDFKRPATESTWVASVANQHDIIPSLDGQGAGNCFDLHPDWYVVDYTDPTHEFPACHAVEHYTANLAVDLPEAREHIDAKLRPYHGPATRSQLYRLYDDEPVPEVVRRGVAVAPAVTRAATASGPVELPVRCDDGYALTAYFVADAQAAAGLLGGRASAVRLGGRAVVAIHVSDNRRTSLGAYAEVGLAVLVAPPGGRGTPRLPSWRALLPRSPRADRVGSRFTDVLVNTELSRAVAEEVFGHAASLGTVRVEAGAGAARVEAVAGGEPVMSLAGTLGPGLPVAAPVAGRSLVVYSDRDGVPVRSSLQWRGTRRAHPSPRLRLAVARSEHPFARHLRDLGLDGARPILCLVAPARRSRRGAAVPLTLPAPPADPPADPPTDPSADPPTDPSASAAAPDASSDVSEGP
ncbi:hypothetical protein [Actinomadura sp. NEAU-AAG7]|uniref:hypothetical protein n=1 Tax=Actinomadura sp. NEAU-AAG7 TaxID=2839640 RepID=UPI001BE452AB|nr:hypothetical protein [Actinomadura sp. NEAU-AAG7]MBT2208834.1 hypothetical protein [Actinomadura sp. NEAU-AAG7]